MTSDKCGIATAKLLRPARPRLIAQLFVEALLQILAWAVLVVGLDRLPNALARLNREVCSNH